MPINLHVTLSLDPASIAALAQLLGPVVAQPQLDRIEASLAALTQKENIIMADLTALTAEVARNTTVEKSALALIQGFSAQLAAAGTDPVKLQALQDTLAANDTELAAAVAANTAPPAA